ncbi:hypothetical protein Scep_002181 [Stephania cephalantha]|uniref:Plastocyanin-like domain-containing protein n=1 Tax=Stephania cephalantha TaxID=152367 RepID=A0AAP0Q4F3_9MAGN
MPSSLKHIVSKALFVLCLCLAFIVNDRRCYGSRIRRFTWEVGYVFWSPDCQEHVVMGINGQFPGPTIRAKVGDTIVVNLTNTLHTEGVVIHWHGIRQFGTPWSDGTASISQCPINPGETFVYRFKVDKVMLFFVVFLLFFLFILNIFSGLVGSPFHC